MQNNSKLWNTIYLTVFVVSYDFVTRLSCIYGDEENTSVNNRILWLTECFPNSLFGANDERANGCNKSL